MEVDLEPDLYRIVSEAKWDVFKWMVALAELSLLVLVVIMMW